MARKKQIEKLDIDMSKFRRIDLPTYYPAFTDIPQEKLEEGKTKICIYMENLEREKMLKAKY